MVKKSRITDATLALSLGVATLSIISLGIAAPKAPTSKGTTPPQGTQNKQGKTSTQSTGTQSAGGQQGSAQPNGTPPPKPTGTPPAKPNGTPPPKPTGTPPAKPTGAPSDVPLFEAALGVTLTDTQKATITASAQTRDTAIQAAINAYQAQVAAILGLNASDLGAALQSYLKGCPQGADDFDSLLEAALGITLTTDQETALADALTVRDAAIQAAIDAYHTSVAATLGLSLTDLDAKIQAYLALHPAQGGAPGGAPGGGGSGGNCKPGNSGSSSGTGSSSSSGSSSNSSSSSGSSSSASYNLKTK